MYDLKEIIAEQIKAEIAEHYDGSFYEPITGILWQDKTPWQLFKFEADVELDGAEFFRVVMIKKYFYDPDDISSVDHEDTVLFEAWEI